MAKKKLQRVSYKDAIIMLEKSLNKQPYQSTWEYDSHGGSEEYFNIYFFHKFIKKINKIMALKKGELSLSDIGFGKKVFINGHVYTYQGQDKKRDGRVMKNMYVFKLESKKNVPQEFWEKTFDVTTVFRIRKYGSKDSDVKFEIY